MKVRAKFKVVEIKTGDDGSGTVKLEAVTSGSPENEQFFKWTPYGVLEMGTINESVLAQFAVGDEVYIDLTPA